MTIAQDTDYILLDEPLNNLDMKHSVQIMQTLKRLCRDFNKTIVIVYMTLILHHVIQIILLH